MTDGALYDDVRKFTIGVSPSLLVNNFFTKWILPLFIHIDYNVKFNEQGPILTELIGLFSVCEFRQMHNPVKQKLNPLELVERNSINPQKKKK